MPDCDDPDKLPLFCARDEKLRKLTLMVINRKPDGPIEAKGSIAGFSPARMAAVPTLNGPDYLTHNDKDDGTYRSFWSRTPAPPVRVKIVESVLHGAANEFSYSFPAHSVMVFALSAR